MDYDSTYDPIFQDVGSKYGIDPLFLKARAIYESGLDPNFKNPDSSASGLGAFTQATAKDYNVDPSDPKSSIDGMARYDIANYKKFKDSDDPITATVSAYKTGPNSNTLDKDYVKNVMGVYQDLKKNQPQGDGQGVKDQGDDAIAKWRTYAPQDSGTQQAAPAPDDFAVDKWRSYGKESPTPQVSVASPPPPLANDATKAQLTGPQLRDLERNNPDAYRAFVEKNVNNAQGEFSYGLGDAPRSIVNVAASVAPDTFSDVARAVAPTYAALTGQPPLTPQDLASSPPSQDAAQFKNNLLQRNAQFQQEYGADPSAGINRLAGGFAATAPVLGAVNKGVGAVGSVVGDLFPSTQPIIDALSGNVESNATVNPLTGATVKSATLGNQAGQYASSGLNAGLQAAPVTALTNAGSDEPISKQLAQNAFVGTGLGAAAPAFFDAGIGTANKVKNFLTPAGDMLDQKAQGALHELIGPPIQKADLTEYVPGSKPSLAKAAAYAGDPNAGGAAALEKTLGESKVGSENLYNSGFKGRESDNDQARRAFALNLTGTPDTVTQLQAARSTEANKLMGNEAKRLTNPNLPKGEVWQNTNPTDVQPALDYIEAARKGPAAGNAGLMKKLDTMEDLLKSPNSKDPQYIYESVIKPQVTDPIEATNPFDSNNATKSQLPYLKQMKSILDDAVGNAAPKYKDYLKTYTDMSKQVERQQGLQSLKLVNPEDPNSAPTLSKVNNAVQKVQAGRQSYDPTDPFKTLTNDDVNKLMNLQKDLTRENAAQNQLTLKGAGSPTSQKVNFTKKVQKTLGGEPSSLPATVLSTGGAVLGEGLASYMGYPYSVGPLASGALATVGHKLGTSMASKMAEKSGAVSDRVSNLLLDPKEYFKSSRSGSGSLPTSGQSPLLQGIFQRTVPYGAVETNRLLAPPGLVPGANSAQ